MVTNHTFPSLRFHARQLIACFALLPCLTASYAAADGSGSRRSHLSVQNKGANTATCRLLPGLQFLYPKSWRVFTEGSHLRVKISGAVENEDCLLSVQDPAEYSSLDDPRLLPALEQEVQQYFPLLQHASSAVHFQTGCGPAIAVLFAGQGQDGSHYAASVFLTLHQGRSVLLMTLAPYDRLKANLRTLQDLFRSLTPVRQTPPASAPASDRTALAQWWLQRLRGKRLVALSSYSSGLSGGYTSQKEFHLFANGTFSFHSSRQVSIYVDGANGSSGGQTSSSGTWRILSRDGVAFLEIVEAGQKALVWLENRNGKTFLNGNRYFVVD